MNQPCQVLKNLGVYVARYNFIVAVTDPSFLHGHKSNFGMHFIPFPSSPFPPLSFFPSPPLSLLSLSPTGYPLRQGSWHIDDPHISAGVYLLHSMGHSPGE